MTSSTGNNSTPNMRAMLGGEGSGTFLGLDAVSLESLESLESFKSLPSGCGAVILGAPVATPYEWVGSYCKGAPSAIRNASATYATSRAHHNFDLNGHPLPDGSIAVDAGDIAWTHDPAQNRDAIRSAVSTVLATGAVPIVLGGDDSVPIPVMQGYADFHGPGTLPGTRPGGGPDSDSDADLITLLQIDAHIDWRDEVRGERWGLSSTMRRCSEMPHVGTMIQVGQRGVGSARPDDVAAANSRGVKFFSAHTVHKRGIAHVVDAIPKGSNIFITVDVDGFDPTTMPAVIGPEPGGLSYFDGVDLIDAAADRGRIVGFDLVEFFPDRDINGLGALTAFRLVAHALGRILRQ